MPRASVSTATRVNAGCFRRERAAYRQSCQTVAMRASLFASGTGTRNTKRKLLKASGVLPISVSDSDTPFPLSKQGHHYYRDVESPHYDIPRRHKTRVHWFARGRSNLFTIRANASG